MQLAETIEDLHVRNFKLGQSLCIEIPICFDPPQYQCAHRALFGFGRRRALAGESDGLYSADL